MTQTDGRILVDALFPYTTWLNAVEVARQDGTLAVISKDHIWSNCELEEQEKTETLEANDAN